MTQTVSAPISAYNNTIVNFISEHIRKVNLVNPERELFREHTVDDNAQDMLTRWLNRLPFIKILEHTIVPAGNLYRADRVIIRFKLVNEFAPHFVLLRGLFEFAKPSGLIILTDRTEKVFVIETSVHQVDVPVSYLKKIFGWLSKEITFKAALKRVIQWEHKVREEQQIIMDDLFSAI